jgi:uncharacterized membrane protein
MIANSISGESLESKKKVLTPWVQFRRHLRGRLLSGLAVVLPMGITIVVLRFLFRIMTRVVYPVTQHLFFEVPRYLHLVIAIAIFIAAIYMIGLITRMVLARKMLGIVEKLMMKIPVLRSVYGASKQFVDTFTISSETPFKSVVLVEFPRKDCASVGFATGTIKDMEGRICYKVFVPTCPNPTSGFFIILPEHEVKIIDLTIEEGIKMILSLGVISPEKFSEILSGDNSL